MSDSIPMAEIWRGPFLESMHRGHAVICDQTGQIVEAWGDPDKIVLSRSASKMVQALPLIQSGAADARGLTAAHLSLACASHCSMPIHVNMVRDWLENMEMSSTDLLCGSHFPTDRETEIEMIASSQTPCEFHNNCSGKHSGFLTLSKHLGAGPDYIDADHPVQKAVLEQFEGVTEETSPGFGIDGCSAPNFASSLHGMARAMAHFAASPDDSAEARLHQAMRLHPEYISGIGHTDTELVRAMDGRAAVKTGAEGFYTAILPEKKLGIALKIEDGATRAAECAIAALLVKLGVLDAEHPAAMRVLNAPVPNRRGITTGYLRAAPALL